MGSHAAEPDETPKRLDLGDWVEVNGNRFRLSEIKLVLDGPPEVIFKHTSELVTKNKLGFGKD